MNCAPLPTPPVGGRGIFTPSHAHGGEGRGERVHMARGSKEKALIAKGVWGEHHPDIKLRIFPRILPSSLEICTCDTPMASAISLCVFSWK